MKKFLVPTDGSKNSEHAIIKARKLAEDLGAKIVVLTVVTDTVLMPYMTEENYNMPTKDDLEKMGNKNLDMASTFFEDFKGDVKFKLRSGNTAENIIDEAEKGNYDLIIMGSRGHGTFSRTILGSVSNKVLNHVKVDVLIVR